YLLGKHDNAGGALEYGLRLTPAGGIEAHLRDTASTYWSAVMPAAAHAVIDDQWHLATMVVDRTANIMKIYVDGIERASAAKTANFGSVASTGNRFYAGRYDTTGPVTTGGGTDFSGALDEIRVSNTAHTASRVMQDYASTAGIRLASVTPPALIRDKAALTPRDTVVVVTGADLDSATGQLLRNGQALDALVVNEQSVYGEARLRISVARNVPLGMAQLVMSKPGRAPAVSNVVINDPAPYLVEADTLLLWRMDEAGSGAARILNAGPLGAGGTAASVSTAVPGRFDGARANAGITADGDGGSLSFPNSSFTAETWVKTGPVGRSYYLLGKHDNAGGALEYGLRLTPAGRLEAHLRDTASTYWSALMPASANAITDDQWHQVAMVVDRTANTLKIYVDGAERASAPKSLNFGSIANTGNRFYAGRYDLTGPFASGGNTEFPGALDEIRISTTAHTAEKIAADFAGADAPRLLRLAPAYVQRGAAIDAPVTVYGAGLGGATVGSAVAGVQVTVVSATTGQLDLRVTIPDATPPGAVPLTITDPIGQTTIADLHFVNQQPFVNATAGSETRLLWHMDEAANGAVIIAGNGDAVPNVVRGAAASVSTATTGRFGGARASAGMTADSDGGALSFPTSSFTIETWVKATPVGRSYYLVGKHDNAGGALEYGLRLTPAGGLEAHLRDTASTYWSALAPPNVFMITDNQWHLVGVVVDRTANTLKIYVDGVERASAGKPSAFGSIANTGNRFYAGRYDTTGPFANGGNPEFPGALDEIRVLNYARSAAQMLESWLGTGSFQGFNQLREPAPWRIALRTGAETEPGRDMRFPLSPVDVSAFSNGNTAFRPPGVSARPWRARIPRPLASRTPGGR
ncbi:MAG: LamG-like jellyroll fold domain-containing protein, partial [Blastocatellia bacterium]